MPKPKKDDDIHGMSPEELGSVLSEPDEDEEEEGEEAGGEGGTPQDPENPEEKSEPAPEPDKDEKDKGTPGEEEKEEPEPEASEKKETPEGEEEKPESEAPESGKEEGTPEEEGKEPTETELLQKRLSDTQKSFHEERRKRLEMEKRLREREKPKPPDEYTEAELEELKYYDSDQYDLVMKAREEYQKQQKEYDERVKREEAEAAEILRQEAVQKCVDSTVGLARFLGVDGFPGKPMAEQPKALQEFVDSPEFKAVVSEVEKHPHRYYEEDGSITERTLRMLYRGINFDKLAVSQRKNGRQEALSSIENAKGKASKLEGLPRESGSRAQGKSLEKMTQSEIMNLGPKALEELLQESEDEEGDLE